jgi:hypothetical protein
MFVISHSGSFAMARTSTRSPQTGRIFLPFSRPVTSEPSSRRILMRWLNVAVIRPCCVAPARCTIDVDREQGITAQYAAK